MYTDHVISIAFESFFESWYLSEYVMYNNSYITNLC